MLIWFCGGWGGFLSSAMVVMFMKQKAPPNCLGRGICLRLHLQFFFLSRSRRVRWRLHHLLVFFFRTYNQIIEGTLTGTGRDQVTYDNVLFQARQVIGLAADRS